TTLQLPDRVAVKISQGLLLERQLDIDDFLDLGQEPGIDMREGMHFFEAEALCERIAHIPDALWAGFSQFNLQFFAISRLLVKPIDTHFESAKRFLERLLEGTANGHDLAHRFHLSGK